MRDADADTAAAPRFRLDCEGAAELFHASARVGDTHAVVVGWCGGVEADAVVDAVEQNLVGLIGQSDAAARGVCMLDDVRQARLGHPDNCGFDGGRQSRGCAVDAEADSIAQHRGGADFLQRTG